MKLRFRIRPTLLGLLLVSLVVLVVGPATRPVLACPFCSAVAPPLRQEMASMDAVVIATATETSPIGGSTEGDLKVNMKVVRVLKGEDLIEVGQQVQVVCYSELTKDRRFLLSGSDPRDLQWSCLPVSKRAEEYVATAMQLEDDPVTRLRFYQQYLQDEESMLARDAYDEFGLAPYDAVKKLGPEMDHDQLVQWISDPEMDTANKRLYLTMLGVCGDEKDLPLLEKMLRSTQKSTRGGLDALIACYLTLAGEEGLSLIDELFLANKKAPYADTYAAIMAIRFHGTEGDVIPRSALVESLHHVLERPDLADLVIPDLARWGDWSQIDRLTKLFIDADADNNWVRVPVVNYLRACPKPEAKAALEKLEEVDPESVRRANTFFSIPVPAIDKGTSSSSVRRPSEDRLAAAPGHSPSSRDGSSSSAATLGTATLGTATAGIAALPVAGPATTIATVRLAPNPWRLAYVLGLALATCMIAQFLLLSGGPQPSPE